MQNKQSDARKTHRPALFSPSEVIAMLKGLKTHENKEQGKTKHKTQVSVILKHCLMHRKVWTIHACIFLLKSLYAMSPFSEFWIFYYHKIKANFSSVKLWANKNIFFWVLVSIRIRLEMRITNEFQTADKNYNLYSMPARKQKEVQHERR